MKFVSFLFGILIFAVGLGLMFGAAGDIFKLNDIDDDGKFSNLEVTYESVANSQSKDGSDIRNIADAAEVGTVGTETPDVRLLTGALQGGRLVLGSIKNFGNIANNVTETIDKDTPTQNYVDEKIIPLIIAISIIFLIIVSIQFIRGFKLET